MSELDSKSLLYAFHPSTRLSHVVAGLIPLIQQYRYVILECIDSSRDSSELTTTWAELASVPGLVRSEGERTFMETNDFLKLNFDNEDILPGCDVFWPSNSILKESLNFGRLIGLVGWGWELQDLTRDFEVLGFDRNVTNEFGIDLLLVHGGSSICILAGNASTCIKAMGLDVRVLNEESREWTILT